MPFRDTHPRRFTPEGLTDAVDGSDAFKGAMSQLVNLIRQTNSKGIVVPRPAMEIVVPQVPDYGGGPITLLQQTGDLFYGFYASAAFAGKDRPFYYDADANNFRTISGLTSANLPASQPTTGPWTPPTAAQVTGRIIFTHPGFAGGDSQPSNFLVFPGGTINGSDLINGPFEFTDEVGGTIIGSGIPLGATIISSAQNTVSTTGSGTIGNSFFTVTSAAGIYIGQAAYGPGLSNIVTGIAGTTISIAGVLSQTFTAGELTFLGTSITISVPATATNPMVELVVYSTASVKFGWLDISGFSTPITGNTLIGVPVVTGNPDLSGIQPGMAISDAGGILPPGTLVVQSGFVSFTATAGTVMGSQMVQIFDGFTEGGFAAGQLVSGPGIPFGTFVVAYNIFTYVLVISQAATVSTTTFARLQFSGAFLLLSKPATASVDQFTLTVTAGTPDAPMWGAGDMDRHPLAAVPVFVAAFNSRAWYGVNTTTTAGVQASDAGFPTLQTNANQTLLFNGAVPVTAAAGLPLATQLGGIIQALMVFQGTSNIQQITGDFAFSNVAVNTLPVSTGTLAPRSIASTNKGLLFSATDGLRLIDFNAAISEPLGIDGRGLSVPFVNASEPTRIVAAYDDNIYRVTIAWQPPQSLQHIWGTDVRTDEFWLHFTSERWSGPHTSLLDAAAPWPGRSSFLTAPHADQGAFYQSDPQPRFTSTYNEFGQNLACIYQTDLLPDNPEQMAISVVDTSLFVGLVSGSEELLVTAIDDMGQTLDQTYVWVGPFSRPAQRQVPWHLPLVFRQMALRVEAGAVPALQLGAVALQTHVLGYQMPYPITPEFILGAGGLGGPDVTGP